HFRVSGSGCDPGSYRRRSWLPPPQPADQGGEIHAERQEHRADDEHHLQDVRRSSRRPPQRWGDVEAVVRGGALGQLGPKLLDFCAQREILALEAAVLALELLVASAQALGLDVVARTIG